MSKPDPMRQTLRAMAKMVGGRVIEYRSRGLLIIEPCVFDSRRNVNLQTIGYVKGEGWFRRGCYYELYRSPMTCERVQP